jgi:hypothetical protein
MRNFLERESNRRNVLTVLVTVPRDNTSGLLRPDRFSIWIDLLRTN